MNEKIIYFSLNEVRRRSFYDSMGKNVCYSQKFSFSLEADERRGDVPNGQDTVPIPLFKDPRDLIPLIENCKKKDSLHVIIDYVSCCSFEKIDNYAEVIRDIIMAYPEVQFLFDETFVNKDTSSERWNFLNFLFKDAGIKDGKMEIAVAKGQHQHDGGDAQYAEDQKIIIQVLTDFHQFDISGGDVESQFIRLLKGKNNMFDGSNLRCAIRTYKLVNKLKVRDNFSKVTESRRDHLAIVVEEEYQQSMFNGYCLYANGYRVIPIMTATELKWINKDENEKYIKEGVDNNTPKATSRLAKFMPVKWCRDKVMEWRRKTDPKTIVVRDYDLQFIDERKCLTVEKPEVINESGEKVEEINEIDLVRGAKYCADITVKKTEGGKEIIDRKYTDDFVLVPKDTKSNPYWKAFENTPTFFVSKGGGKLITKKCIKKKKRPMYVNYNGKKLVLYGIQKPIEGIYVSMQDFKPVRNRYKKTVYGILRKKKNFYRMSIKREEVGGHGCPLDIYGIVRSMVNRAELYYRFGRPRLAALVTGEAIEILNGFHMSLMKQAYYIKAVSENAMAMSLLGGDEGILSDDLLFRMRKVREEVNRLVQDNEDRENLLMNIYNDCRLFCREKEYLDAADDALSYMMRDKEGWDLFSRIRDRLS